MESTSIYAALAAVQSELKAPKGQMNTFGGYRYVPVRTFWKQ